MGHDVFFTNESGCQSHVRADRTDEMIDLLMLNIYCQSVRPVIQRTETQLRIQRTAVKAGKPHNRKAQETAVLEYKLDSGN